jgi:pilus assembly protein CpaE
MTEILLTVRLGIMEPRLKEQLKEFVISVPGTRVLNSGSQESCDLLIKELGSDLNSDFHEIRTLKDAGLVREIFLTSSSTDSSVLIQGMRAGAREFLTQPIQQETLRVALNKCIDQKIQDRIQAGMQKLGKIVVVMGGKGGAGATTVAVNLAASLNEIEDVSSVALIDMNLFFGEVPLFMDLEPAFNWGEVAKNISRLDLTYLMGVLSRHSSGVYVLPSPTQLDGINVATPEIIDRLLMLMKTKFDYIVIDSGQSLDNMSLKILELSDILLLISFLSLPCLINTRKLLETFASLGYPREDKIKIVMNRHSKKAVISPKEAEKGLGRSISWLIPNDWQTTLSALNQGKLLSEYSSKSEITNNFRKLAKTVRDATEKDEGTGENR